MREVLLFLWQWIERCCYMKLLGGGQGEEKWKELDLDGVGTTGDRKMKGSMSVNLTYQTFHCL
jgi:hypothetical protein